MQTPEPFTDLQHEPLLDHHHPPQQTTTKPLFTRVVSGVTFVVFFFAFAIVFIVLNQQNSSVHIDTNSDKSFIRYSKADRLSWERTAFHFQPAKNFIYDPNGMCFSSSFFTFTEMLGCKRADRSRVRLRLGLFIITS
ncbi:putative 2,1-fructan:2,1-fructan 1-fructosyltransferase [Helianthus annuus]|nr:putative 2,1-fructan:2,1-fructan 1-fructosyltransferase [Helianthus annuus]